MLLLLKYKRSIKSAKRLLLEFEVSSDSLLLPYLILLYLSNKSIIFDIVNNLNKF